VSTFFGGLRDESDAEIRAEIPVRRFECHVIPCADPGTVKKMAKISTRAGESSRPFEAQGKDAENFGKRPVWNV
jgi:hypothetical protein